MRLWSPAWSNGEPIPPRLAAGRLTAQGRVEFGENRSPPLIWTDLPEGTGSLVLLCHDFDVPVDRSLVNRPDCELPAESERTLFYHWVLVDVPPSLSGFEEGQWSLGFTPRGKAGPATDGPIRQGLNDYTGWFEGDAALAGRYHGYDGPFPPANDSLVHHYVFTLFALDVPRLALEGRFTGEQVRQALTGHVLGAATHSGTYTLNRRLTQR